MFLCNPTFSIHSFNQIFHQIICCIPHLRPLWEIFSAVHKLSRSAVTSSACRRAPKPPEGRPPPSLIMGWWWWWWPRFPPQRRGKSLRRTKTYNYDITNVWGKDLHHSDQPHYNINPKTFINHHWQEAKSVCSSTFSSSWKLPHHMIPWVLWLLRNWN